MGSRIGRKSAAETYPVSPGAQGGSAANARNSAVGPAGNVTITAAGSPPTQAITWQFVEAGVNASPNVVVTPRASGDFKVTAVVNVSNPQGAAIELLAVVTVNGTAVSEISQQSVPIGANSSLTLLPFGVSGLPLGTPANIGVKVSGNGLQLTAASSTIFVEEVRPATG
jgi:hypothetical protein